MARTLPWLKDQGKASQTGAQQRPAKRLRFLDPNSNDAGDDALLPTATASPQRKALSKRDRSPSTSPAPEPPTEEVMYAGLNHDDIYIMVEDEFHAIARTFTAHLHHAEYVRLRNLAKAKKGSGMAAPPIERPTDSIMVMRAEMRMKKNGEEKAKKQKAGLEKLGAGVVLKRGKDDEGDKEDAEKGVRDDAPWTGTTLAGLMTRADKTQVSLTGLYGVKSSTRAAAGFMQAAEKKQMGGKTFDLAPKPKSMFTKRRVEVEEKEEPRNVVGGGEETASEDDDDLDILLQTRRVLSPTATPIPEAVSKRPKRPFKPPNATRIEHDLGGFPKPTPLMRKRPEPKDNKKGKDNGDSGTTRINEIPIFLV